MMQDSPAYQPCICFGTTREAPPLGFHTFPARTTFAFLCATPFQLLHSTKERTSTNKRRRVKSIRTGSSELLWIPRVMLYVSCLHDRDFALLVSLRTEVQGDGDRLSSTAPVAPRSLRPVIIGIYQPSLHLGKLGCR
ncbi:unnamed protein product [Peniophora sp. CBMAI 1063]|nr:unnamed protein product [Peniophora sp. CBMAI 1063]